MPHRETALYTIGYQGRDLDELLAELRVHRITKVVDVRDVPASPRRGFSKSPLGAALHADGIGYEHLREAGNPYRHSIEPGVVLARYREHLVRKLDILEHAVAQIRGERAALLCYERDARRCHRSVLAAGLQLRFGITVVDL